MNPEKPALENRPVLLLAASHWLARLGLGLVLTAIASWLFLIPIQLRHGQDNPYIGVAAVVVVPLVLFVGVVLTPIGIWRGKQRARALLEAGVADRKLAWKRFLAFLAVTALLNVAIGTQATYRAVHHMESRQFCGSCHVMAPESAAFPAGPHAGILCVDCHVGNGALGWLDSKMQGTRQLIEVLTDSVPRPIPSAIESGHMVSSRETCEECHWKERPGAVRLLVRRRYAEDEANTPETTVLTMHVGGSAMGGIHGAHNAAGVKIRFVAADARRQDIPWVEYENTTTGERRAYVRAGASPADYEGKPQIEMQCIDCHNRAAHAFQDADRAVDRALTLGEIPASLPFAKKLGVEVLTATYADSEDAAARIPAALAGAYAAQHPDVAGARADAIAEAGRALAAAYARNVFPELGVTWGTYPDNRGHQDSPGCLRCHDGEHVSEAGEKITKDCFVCHAASAVEETDAEVLKVLGLDRPIDAMRRK